MKTIRKIKSWAWKVATENWLARKLGLAPGSTWDEVFWKPRFERAARQLNLVGFHTEKPCSWKDMLEIMEELHQDLLLDLESLDEEPVAA